MSEPIAIEINCETGEVVERLLTVSEIEQRETDTATALAEEIENNAIKEAKISARLSAIAKLTSLGLTEEEAIAVIGE